MCRSVSWARKVVMEGRRVSGVGMVGHPLVGGDAQGHAVARLRGVVAGHVGHQRRVARQLQRELQAIRSEEHTSELQSQSNLVCRLLLEKKKKTANNSQTSQ